MTVRPLSLDDPATVRALIALQRASYRVEADLIGADVIPGLTETEAELAASGETFLGMEDGGGIVAAVSYRREGDLVDIHRLVVHPRAFRRGLATEVLDALDARERDAPRWTVSTAAANAPARALYERRGFALAEEHDARGVALVRYERAGTPARRA